MNPYNQNRNTIQFFQTGMGRVFFEGTMPKIARSLKGILELLNQNGQLKMTEIQLNRLEKNLESLASLYINPDGQLDFFQTVAGHKFYEGTMKSIADNLEDIASSQNNTADIFELLLIARAMPDSYELKMSEDRKRFFVVEKASGNEQSFTDIKNLKEYMDRHMLK